MRQRARAVLSLVSMMLIVALMSVGAPATAEKPPSLLGGGHHQNWPITYGHYNATMDYIVLMPGWNLITLCAELLEQINFMHMVMWEHCYFGPIGNPGTSVGFPGYVSYIEEAAVNAYGLPNPDPGMSTSFYDRDTTAGDFRLPVLTGHSYWVFNEFVYNPGPNPDPPPGGWPPPNYVQVWVGQGIVQQQKSMNLGYGWQSIGLYGVDNWRPIGHEHAGDIEARLSYAPNAPWSINAWDAANQCYLNYNFDGIYYHGTNFVLTEHMGLSIFVDGPRTLTWHPEYTAT